MRSTLGLLLETRPVAQHSSRHTPRQCVVWALCSSQLRHAWPCTSHTLLL